MQKELTGDSYIDNTSLREKYPWLFPRNSIKTTEQYNEDRNISAEDKVKLEGLLIELQDEIQEILVKTNSISQLHKQINKLDKEITFIISQLYTQGITRDVYNDILKRRDSIINDWNEIRIDLENFTNIL